MAYRTMNITILKETIRRHIDGQSNRHIGRCLAIDHCTVSKYLRIVEKLSGMKLKYFLDSETWPDVLNSLVDEYNTRHQKVPHELDSYREEIGALFKDCDNPLKPKSIYEVLRYKYDIKASYSSFKRYFRRQAEWAPKSKPIIRIEVEPGSEVQVDYGFVGYYHDPYTSKKRKVYAFCARLSYSRLPFIQFVYSQDQASFVKSNTDMLTFFDGIPEKIIIDNLKSGIIKPSLYDPLINRAYHEWAEYYGVFIDPARVATATDKGKVERGVPDARELFRKLLAMHPTASMLQLNKQALTWCKEEYGRRDHGTTGIPPMDLYEEEKQKLKALPKEPFCVPMWKRAKVHPDQFFHYGKKRYSMPEEYKSKEIEVRHIQNSPQISVFYRGKHIRDYIIPHGWFGYEKSDFPNVRNEFIESGYSKYLLREASRYGDACYRLVKEHLGVNAFLNCRRVRPIIDFARDHQDEELLSRVFFEALRVKEYTLAGLKIILNDTKSQLTLDEYAFPETEEGKAMARDISAYTK